MKTPWTTEMGTGPYPEQFAQLNADTYIQRRNIKDAPEREGVDNPGWICESRKISSNVYEALQEAIENKTAIADNTNALVDLGDVTEGNNSDSESAMAELADMVASIDERITALETAKGE